MPVTETPPQGRRGSGLVIALSVVLSGILLAGIGFALHDRREDQRNAITGQPQPAPPGAAAGGVAGPPVMPNVVASAMLLMAQGDGTARTALFTTGDNWTLAFGFDCAHHGGSGRFTAGLYSPAGQLQAVPVDTSGQQGGSTVAVHSPGGQHYLEVTTECVWTLTVPG